MVFCVNNFSAIKIFQNVISLVSFLDFVTNNTLLSCVTLSSLIVFCSRRMLVYLFVSYIDTAFVE